MAKNLTQRVTLVTVEINDTVPEQFVFITKEAMEQYLYGLAVANWQAGTPIPATRKGCLEQFFNPKAGNAFRCSTVTQISDEAAVQAGANARNRVRSLVNRQRNRRPITAGR